MIPHSRPTMDEAELRQVQQSIETSYLSKGPKCRAFSEALAKRYSRTYAVLCNSGLSSLHMALLALGAKEGQRVFVPSYCCTALLNAIYYTGASACIVDTPHGGFLADPKAPFLQDPERDILIYPQLLGVVQPLEVPEAFRLIEDCAMSLSERACRQGHVSIASFFATKMLATGQGGAVLGSDEKTQARLLDLMAYDNRADYKVRYNVDMNDIQAALGLAQLDKLDSMLEKRRELCRRYDAVFTKRAPQLLANGQGLSEQFSEDALFRYWIMHPQAEELISRLREAGIECKRPVYKPLHHYLNLESEKFPHCEAFWQQAVSIPFYPTLEEFKKPEELADTIVSLL